jgi:predicted nucleic acid-binding protein
MKLVVDANILIAELLRKRGRELLRNPRLELYLAEKTREETEYELRKRVGIIVSQGRLNESAGRTQIGCISIL